MRAKEFKEAWSQKYKSSINCAHPKGFSQRAHCAGKKKHNESTEMEMVCEDCGMCQTHGNINEIKKGEKDANGYTRCWPGKHAEGTKKGKNGGQVRNCVPNESVAEGLNEFAPTSGDNGGNSGRWYTDDELADIIGDDWFEDFDVSNDGFNIDAYGEKAKKNLVGYANAWFDDKGYNVNVMGVEHNDVDHDLQWYIVGSFHNPRFADEGMAEGFNGEYDDEAGMAQSNLYTIAKAAQGLLDTIDDYDNLPEWVQEKIAKVEGMMVTAWNYLQSQKAQGIDPQQKLDELSFLGSQCTKDCSGHRAGYDWYKRKGRDPFSHSQSFNNGAGLAKAGK